MTFEIAIDELGIGNDRTAYVMLPANKNTVIDAMDRARVFGETFVRIERCDKFPELNGYEFSEEPTVDELNFLAKRLEEISSDKEDITSIIAYRALLQRGVDTINEAINRTYNLQTIPVYPCKNVHEYGEIVLENEMLEELDDVPDEVYDWLDPDKVGRAMMDREGGVFIDGYYAVANSYEPALVYDEELPEQQEDWIFRLEVAAVPEKPEDISKVKTEILTLPADEKYMRNIAELLGEKSIDVCNCMNFKSAIPQIRDDCFESMEDVYLLNEIAKKYSELSREDAAKFKAVLQNEHWNSLDKAEDIFKNLSGYNFDISVTDASDFGREYLSEMLPPDFDSSLLDGVNAAELAQNVLHINGGAITSYGAVSGYGGQLYLMVEAPQQEQENSFEMGGLS